MPDFSRPETWTAVGFLLAAVLALIRGTVMPGITHDRIVAQLKELHAKEIDRLERSEALWRQIALRGVQLTETSLDVIRKVKE